MSKFARLLSGGFLGALVLTLIGTPSAAWADYTLDCDGNVCCTIDKSTGAIGTCKTVS